MDIVIANDDRRDLFADISYQRIGWAEVIFDAASERFMVTILGPPEGHAHLTFDLAEALEALQTAKQRLMQMGYGSERIDVE